MKIKKPTSNKIKTVHHTFTWKPPTKEEVAAQKEKERELQLRDLREIGIYLEGMKRANIMSLHPLGTSHLSSLWTSIKELEIKK